MAITIREIHTRRELRQFVRFPFWLYAECPHWVPPLIRAEMALLSPESNPAFEHSDVTIRTAWENGRMAGRIVGILNHKEAEFIGEKHVRFGWFDFIDDKRVSEALIHSVEKWAREKGATRVKGPYGFNQLDKNGWLTEGFDLAGTANTIYNYPYYPLHIESLGYVPDLCWVEIKMYLPEKFPERFTRYKDLAQRRYHLKTRHPSSKADMPKMGRQLFDLLMDTYQGLPGFVPISKKQQEQYVRRYLRFLRKDFISVVYDQNDLPIAFGIVLPSMTKAFQKARGHLFPFGFLHFLAARQWNDTADLALIGVKEEWRKKGAHSLVFTDIGNAVLAAGIRQILINPMLETNKHVLSLWKNFDHHIYKRRKTFIKYL
ncbi:MAG TPA: hypothetical protein ENJ20_04870 [Bacteroidetes bacterium]|nr:hypothetical protein [Bacteroidota bacterium]